MDLNILLWLGGIFFSLGIFAVKVGFGLGLGGVKWRGMVFTLSLYLVIFILIALLSGRLLTAFEFIMKSGGYLHISFAFGMLIWGAYLLRGQKPTRGTTSSWEGGSRDLRITPEKGFLLDRASLWLLLPCPVCLAAIAFSTWAALTVIKVSPFLVGIGLGLAFAFLTLVFLFPLKWIHRQSSPSAQRISLGLTMMTVGLYFLLSLFLPGKIEEAKEVYSSFLSQNETVPIRDIIGVLLVLFTAMVIGFFRKRAYEKNSPKADGAILLISNPKGIER